jgi:hypothetical protein
VPRCSFSDRNGHRFRATLTEREGDAVQLERLHRARANTDRVRAANKPAWTTSLSASSTTRRVSHIAQDLIAPTQRPALDDDLAVSEPKALRYRLLAHRRPPGLARPPSDGAPATHPARADALAAAFARLLALPPPAR